MKRIRPYVYAGLGYNLDYRFNIKPEDTEINLANYSGYKYGTGSNSVSSGLSVNLVYDTRNNTINPMPGMYANQVYRVNPAFLGSNNTWSSLYLDASWNPAAGTGLRLKFNKGSNTNIGIDYGMSKGYRSITFNLGEAF